MKKGEEQHEFADSAFLNIVANFYQCLSPIASKPSTQDTNTNLGKASCKTSHGFVGFKCFTLVGRGWQRLIDY